MIITSQIRNSSVVVIVTTEKSHRYVEMTEINSLCIGLCSHLICLHQIKYGQDNEAEMCKSPKSKCAFFFLPNGISVPSVDFITVVAVLQQQNAHLEKYKSATFHLGVSHWLWYLDLFSLDSKYEMFVCFHY